MTSFRFPHAILGIALTAAAMSAQAAVVALPSFSALYVFGDSLSDSGNNAFIGGSDPGQFINNNTYVPTKPYAFNAYTNGLTWVNSFAAGLGLPTTAAMPSITLGGNYAYGGAKTVQDGTDVPSAPGFPPSAATQLMGTGPSIYQVGYLTMTGMAPLPATALYVIAIGGNDVRDLSVAVAMNPALALTISGAAAAYATAVGNMVDALQAKGAQRIVVWDAPDVGKTPAALAGGAAFSGLATSIASNFNSALTARMAGEAGVTVFDVFGITNTVIGNPAAFGLTNVTDACGALGAACDPSKYLFWDGIHPTSAGHDLLAAGMLAAVPEPSSMLMLAVGICALLAWRRRA